MRKITILFSLSVACFAASGAATIFCAKTKFGYTDASGKKRSIEVVDKYYRKIVQPFRNDSKIDQKLRRAATIAEERARAFSFNAGTT
jgi:hypothetical protein